MRKKVAALTAVLVATAATLIPTSPVYALSVKRSHSLKQAQIVEAHREILKRHAQRKNKDYVALERELNALGYTGFTISSEVTGNRGVRASEMQKLHDAWMDRSEDAGILAVPTDAFTVEIMAFHYRGTPSYPYDYDSIAVEWNFRDNYVNGSDPDDLVAIGLGGMDPDCHYFQSHGWGSWDYQGNNTELAMYLYQQTETDYIWGLRDRASGFVLNVDNGIIDVTINHSYSESKCHSWHDHDLHANGYYEHNQDGSGGWSASVGVAGLSVSYGGSPGARLQKSTGLIYVTS